MKSTIDSECASATLGADPNLISGKSLADALMQKFWVESLASMDHSAQGFINSQLQDYALILRKVNIRLAKETQCVPTLSR